MIPLRRDPCLFASVEGTSGGDIAVPEMLADDADAIGSSRKYNSAVKCLN